jgi:hypothetical protein
MGCIKWKYGTGFPVIEKVMNNLVLTKKRIKKAEMLHAAQLATFKKGVFTSYKPSVFEERQKQVREEVASMDS